MPSYLEYIDKYLSILLAVLTIILVLGGTLALLIFNIREKIKNIFNKNKLNAIRDKFESNKY